MWIVASCFLIAVSGGLSLRHQSDPIERRMRVALIALAVALGLVALVTL